MILIVLLRYLSAFCLTKLGVGSLCTLPAQQPQDPASSESISSLSAALKKCQRERDGWKRNAEKSKAESRALGDQVKKLKSDLEKSSRGNYDNYNASNVHQGYGNYPQQQQQQQQQQQPTITNPFLPASEFRADADNGRRANHYSNANGGNSSSNCNSNSMNSSFMHPSHHQQPPPPSQPAIHSNVPESLKRKYVRPVMKNKNNLSNSSHHQQQSGKRPKAATNQSVNSNNNSGIGNGGGALPTSNSNSSEDELPPELEHLDAELIKSIKSDIITPSTGITFSTISGLASAKKTITEVVIWPLSRPDIFTGLRTLPSGLLLFGPPGTGKTLIGKAIANESQSTFFAISSSSLTSKWVGQGEKLVKTLFHYAAYMSPSVVFIDEVDSLLKKRSDGEAEHSRRLKTELLVQLEGAKESNNRVLLIGATNRPAELDDAARRRFVKRLYIPLPDFKGRLDLITKLLVGNAHSLTSDDLSGLAKKTEGFSGADLKSLCNDASMGPIRQLGPNAMTVKKEDIPPISYEHFKCSLKNTRPSVAKSDLLDYLEFDKEFGSGNDAGQENDENENE